MDQVHEWGRAAIEVTGVTHAFGARTALTQVSMTIPPGEIHSLIGPNGAGKTTMLRVLSGLLHPQSGRAVVAGVDATADADAVRRRIGLMPTGERTLYYRISGFENLVFFGRLQGLTRREATHRARALLAEVGLADAADLLVGAYSNGMKKRLSFARALLAEPPVLLIDEATHDLDVDGARAIRNLAVQAVQCGATVLWATQRLDELRGFADGVTLLVDGHVRFQGTIDAFVAEAPRRYVVEVRNGSLPPAALLPSMQDALATIGSAVVTGPFDEDRYVLSLANDTALGEAISVLATAELYVTSCREQRPPIEEAFIQMTRGAGA